jgi:putative ABC transport system permease protein
VRVADCGAGCGSDGVQVLTGAARRKADADPDRDSEAVTAMNALFGTAGGVTAFVSVFVVASTFAFAVAQRRREFGLLRTAGATPGQIRRLVLAEALTVGVLASTTGWALGSYGAPALGLTLASDPGDLLHRKTYVSRPMLLITAVALLAPAVVRPLTRLLAWLPARLPGACGMLVRENAVADVRRTAAIAAPVLVTIALAGSLPGAAATLDAAEATETRTHTAASYVVTPGGGSAFDEATLRHLRAVPGATVSATAPSTVYVLEDGVALIKSEARAAEAGPLAATTRLPLVAGRVSDLDDDSIIVNEEWEQHTVGRKVRVWLGDGTRRTLRIAAVMAAGTGNNGTYVTPANARGAAVDRVDVALADGADPSVVAAGLRAAVSASGGLVRTEEQWVAATYPETNRTTRAGFLLVLGIALLYTGISLANTMVMATSDRVWDLAVLRLAGATRWQVLRLVGAEALTVVTVGALLGLVVAGLDLTGMWVALRLLSVRTTIEPPWATIGVAVAACALLAVVSSVVPAGLALRRRAAELAGLRE